MLCRKRWTRTIRKVFGLSDAAITRCAVIMYESVRGRLNHTPDMGDVVNGLIDQMNSVETRIIRSEQVSFRTSVYQQPNAKMLHVYSLYNSVL